MGKELDNIADLLTKSQKGSVVQQLVWATCQSVDWDNKTMTCKSVVDGLEYYDVLLGRGFMYIKPVIGAMCLIGSISNKDAARYLIDCEEIEECLIEDKSGFKIHLNNGNLTLNGDGLGSMIKVEELVNKMNRLENKVNDLITKYNTHTHITTATVGPTPTPGVIAPTTAVVMPVQPLTNVNELSNPKIKHG